MERTLPAMLEAQAERLPGKTLVRAGERAWTYAQARDAAARRAGALAAAGVERGDRVAVMSENRLEVLELWLGCAWLGAVLVPVNTALRGLQIEHVLASAAPKLSFAEAASRDRLTGSQAIEELPPGEPVAAAPVEPGDACAILYTSGTTGASKGVVCPHEQWWWWGRLTGNVLGIGSDDVLYTSLPLFHTNALNAFCQALLGGATYVLGPRFSVSQFWSRLVEADATVTYLLGAMISMLYRQPPSELDRAHRTRIALAPATPAELHEPFHERFGMRLIDAWGSTETNVVLSNTPEQIRPGTIGQVLDPFEARVEPDGELLVRTREPLAFATGYFANPEATAQSWRGGWFHTGDRVSVDDEGWYRFLDRKKDAIRRRGENVSSYEVEQALLSHPDVAAAAVVGVPSELGEEEVLACVVARTGAALEPLAVVQWCEPRLAYFAIPRYVELVTELPLTPSGKIEKYKLRERGVTGSTWDREQVGYRLSR